MPGRCGGHAASGHKKWASFNFSEKVQFQDAAIQVCLSLSFSLWACAASSSSSSSSSSPTIFSAANIARVSRQLRPPPPLPQTQARRSSGITVQTVCGQLEYVISDRVPSQFPFGLVCRHSIRQDVSKRARKKKKKKKKKCNQLVQASKGTHRGYRYDTLLGQN
ncbi:hypothetical protein FN846DRAFT_710271 [Sphaerosporella brunnea]|uniref:Uncharacterized protein n=1 Tax=Sphaerosporella brunnea TaxID=1250544 RepID=A0A5J5EXC2_9PEZI|nr:hypothetical protein FN846DRAFT_710271 [Sphaerosporella brunnea]